MGVTENMKEMPDDYWKDKLTAEQYRVMRERGTEAPGTGKYVEQYDDGSYRCAACGQELFESKAKFESSQPGLIGWPAFYEAAKPGSVELKEDRSFGGADRNYLRSLWCSFGAFVRR